MTPSPANRLQWRPAQPEDTDAAIALQCAAFAALTRAAWGAQDPDRLAAGMREAWCPEETRCLWLDDVLVGWVRVVPHPGYDWLDLIVIAPPHQGQGLGSAVLERLKAEAARRGVPLWLSVYRINPARRLYTRRGFSTHGRDPVRILMGHPADAPPPLERLAPGPDRS